MGVLIDVQEYRAFVADKKMLSAIDANPGMYVKPLPQEAPKFDLFSTDGFIVELGIGVILFGAGVWVGRGK